MCSRYTKPRGKPDAKGGAISAPSAPSAPLRETPGGLGLDGSSCVADIFQNLHPLPRKDHRGNGRGSKRFSILSKKPFP